MNINKDRLAFLLKAYVEHTISDLELEELSEYIRDEEKDPALEELMNDFWAHMTPDHGLFIPKDSIYENITQNPLFKSSASPVAKPLYGWRTVFLYAASLFLILASGLILYRYTTNTKIPADRFAGKNLERIIRPGMTKAVLTLANGSRLVLQDAEKGTLASQNGVLLEQDNGRLIYHGDKEQENISEFSQNSIATPRGGEYQLHLGDGTIVWLNSASSISYPVAFRGNERRVKISGEAYFEVAKNPKMPFIVEANGTEVKVLGTHFNVSAY